MSNLTNISLMYSHIPDNEEESDIFFFHTDHLGSTAYMTNKDGETCQFISYMPYGEAIIDEHNTDYENVNFFDELKIIQGNFGMFANGNKHISFNCSSILVTA